MELIPTNKKELLNFIKKEFPGDWIDDGYQFYLPVWHELNQHYLMSAISFRNTGVRYISLFSRDFNWKDNVSLEEAKKYYKTHYKMNNFR